VKPFKILRSEEKTFRPLSPAGKERPWQVKVQLIGDKLELEICDPTDPQDIESMWEPGGASHYK